MSPARERPAVLDTGVLVHYARRSPTYQAIEEQFGPLTAKPEYHILSTVVEGEALALANYQNWGQPKLSRLREMLGQLVRVNAGQRFVVDAYVGLYAVARSSGQAIGQNDLWIAATALATGADLYTCDDDFCFLSPQHLLVHYVPETA